MDAVLFGKVGALEDKVEKLTKEINAINRVIDIELETPTINASSISIISEDIGYGTNKFIIQSIYIEGAQSASVECEIRSTNKIADYFIYYQNGISNNIIYDNVQIPFVDDMGLDKIHLYIKNDSVTNTRYRVRIMGILAT